MLVVPSKKALVVKSRNPDQLLGLIPTAKPVVVNGQKLVAVPHRLDETRVLSNMGMAPPSPIRYHYKWSGLYQPFKAQLDTAEFLTLHPRSYVLNEMGCVDASTEYLSPTGWKRIDQYDGGKVAQYVPETGKAEYVQPSEYVKLPCETMIRFKTSKGVDQLLSPEHRVLYRTSTGALQVKTAAHVLKRHNESKLGWKGRIITTFATDGEAGVSYSDAEIRLQVAVIADGHFPAGLGTRACIVRLKKPRKKERLRQLLTAAGYSWREHDPEYDSAPGFTVFRFAAPLRTKNFAWAWTANNTQLKVIADEVGHWDGSVRKAGAVEFFSRDKENADFVQYAFSATGRTASLLTHQREDGVDYTIHARPKAADLYVCGANNGTKSNTVYTEPSPDGFKYCFMVPSTFLVLRRNGCVFVTGNTGKTMAVLWAYDYLRSIGKLHRMLVTCPLSTMERTWADELFSHFPHLDYVVLYGTAERRRKLLRQPADVYIVNHDGMRIIQDDLKDRDDIDIIVPDEVAQVARNARTDRWRILDNIVNKQQKGTRWCWGMTGTPTPNAPTDAWAQCKLVTPSSVPSYFNKFKDMVMKQVNQFLWVPRPNATETVHAVMQPSIRFSRADCLDLPPCLFQTRHVDLTNEQRVAYRDMLNRLKAEIDGGEVLAVNEAVKTSKLVQIACGAAYDTNGDEVSVDSSPRLEVVREIIEEAEGKVIVFVPFVSAVRLVADYLRKQGTTVECIYGEVSKTERDRIFGAFQNTSTPRVLVAQPAAMSHGLTLTAANTIVWYAPIFSNDIYDQACARITRPGQKLSQLIVNIEGSPVEQKMYERLKKKQTMQGLLLAMVEDSRIETVA